MQIQQIFNYQVSKWLEATYSQSVLEVCKNLTWCSAFSFTFVTLSEDIAVFGGVRGAADGLSPPDERQNGGGRTLLATSHFCRMFYFPQSVAACLPLCICLFAAERRAPGKWNPLLTPNTSVIWPEVGIFSGHYSSHWMVKRIHKRSMNDNIYTTWCYYVIFTF